MRGLSVLRRPAAISLLGYLIVGRTAGAAFPIAFVVVLAQSRGYAEAAFLQGLMVLAFAGTAPLRARVPDKWGSRKALVPQTITYISALVALTACAVNSRVSSLAIGALAFVAAISAPALDSAVRTSWRRTARTDDEVKLLHVLDSLVEEAGFFAGPVLASVLMLTAGLHWSISILTLGTCLSIILPLLTPAVRRDLLVDRQQASASEPPAAPANTKSYVRIVQLILGPIARPDLRGIVSPIVVMGTSFGLLAITIPGLAANHGSIATSGFITAAISAGGVIGGLAYGALNLRSTLWRRQVILSLIFGLPIVALLFTRSPWAVAAILLVSGLAVTPLYINSYLLIDEGIPSEVKHEANSWVGVGNDLGYTIGISVGGLLIAQHGVSSPLIGAGLIGAVLTIIALRGLTLKPAKTKSDTESQVVV